MRILPGILNFETLFSPLKFSPDSLLCSIGFRYNALGENEKKLGRCRNHTMIAWKE